MHMPTEIRKAKLVSEITVGGVKRIHGVTFDGKRIWFADGTRGGLCAVDPVTKKEERRIDVEADAGTAFDGTHLYQVGKKVIRKVDLASGEVVATLPLPDDDVSGLAWADGALYAGGFRGRSIRKLDPKTGKVQSTIRSDRFVTGITWVDGELWHGTLEGPRGGGESEIRRVDPDSGDVLARLELPRGMGCSGAEADDQGRIWFGDTNEGKLVAVERPRKPRAPQQ
jgi:glutamine cyclotransferase